ncbi:HigA family addiction module antitoxin [Orrella sp. 11846]|uniref:HigA family addiction module antitoxin n=1 Tax=Orrella sp. 11846 TaxID=3409913 RepID=UPI003B5B696E
MIRIATNRTPTHPGEILLEEFLKPMEISQRQLADAICFPYQRINELINGKRGITASTALHLAQFFDVTPDFWLNLQARMDLYKAAKSEEAVLKNIRTFSEMTATYA